MTCERAQSRNRTMFQNSTIDNNVSLPVKGFMENPFQISKPYDGDGVMKYIQLMSNPNTNSGSPNVKETNCTNTSDRQYVSDIAETDVFLGSGANSQDYNTKFAALVNQNRSEYSRSIKLKKLAIARRVVDEIRKSDPPGRFLSLEEGSGHWYIVSDRFAAKEVGKVLAENTCVNKLSNEFGDASMADEQVGSQELSGFNYFKQDDCKDKKRKRDIDSLPDSIKSPRSIEDNDSSLGSESSHPLLNKISNYLAMNQTQSHASLPNLPPYSLSDVNAKANRIPSSGMLKEPKQYASLPRLNPIDAAKMMNVPANNVENSQKHVEAIRENFLSALSLNSTLPRSTIDLKTLTSNELSMAKIINNAQSNVDDPRFNLLNNGSDISIPNLTAGYGFELSNYLLNRAMNKKTEALNHVNHSQLADGRQQDCPMPALSSIADKVISPAKAISSTSLSSADDEACKEKDSSKEPDLNFVDEIKPHDILCGRGGMTNNHFGNKRFRKLVDQHRQDYIEASKIKKPDVARLIVKTIRSETPAGRFLKKDARTGKWYEISNRKAAEKASQALREKLHLRN